jgi:CheY-like chemotaxis protein/HPt (histidine-containing phosphotransfer) domain-containing protein
MPVLIAEDNLHSRQYLLDLLNQFGMEPSAVITGEEAISALDIAVKKGNPFPVLILDSGLPGLFDGLATAELIMKHKDLKNTNIIVVSMSQRMDDREYFASLGIDQFMTRPFSPSELLDAIQNTLVKPKSKKEKPDHPAAKANLDAVETKPAYRILLAEDNKVNQQVARVMLQSNGYAVTIANNGVEAVALWQNGDFDLVLMDIQMPEMNGYEATKKIREKQAISENYLPIIGLTANALNGDREKCIEAGMDDYLSKPIIMDRFIELVKKYLEKRQYKNNDEIRDTRQLADINALLEKLNHNKEILRQCLNTFESETGQIIKSIESSIQKKDYGRLKIQSHSLRGSLLTMEMTTAAQIAEEIEGCSDHKKRIDSGAVRQLKKAISASVLLINQFLSNP